MVFLLLITSSVSYVYSFKQTCSYKISYVKAGVASGGWVPMGEGAATAIHPKAEEHPQAYQPPAMSPPRPEPHYSTRRPEARSPVEVKRTNPRNKEKKKGEEGGDPKPRRRRDGGEPRETLRY